VLLQHVAKARGKLRPGGTADTIAAARVVLSDWNDGRIRFYTEPPQRSSGGHDGAAIVKDWAADFSADQVGSACRWRSSSLNPCRMSPIFCGPNLTSREHLRRAKL